MDETWLYHYDTEKKQQSIEWWHSGSPRPKKFRVQKSAGKVLTSISWDQDSILLIDYLYQRAKLSTQSITHLCLMSSSPTLFSGSGPVRLPPVPWTEKTIERSPFFVQHRGHCCHGDLAGRKTF